jgi:hypothetical protein
VQVHKAGDDVRVFTRNLNDVTVAVPELVALTRALPAQELILDGETIALTPDGAPLPFQVTMRRFGRKLDVEAMQASLPLSTFFFDCLYLDGQPLIDAPGEARHQALLEATPAAARVLRTVTEDRAEARRFVAEAFARGHEGAMAKALDAAYEAGSRGAGWLKLKQAPHPRPGDPGRGVGERAPQGLALEPAPRRKRACVRPVRDAGEDLQGPHRRHVGPGRPRPCSPSRPTARATWSSSAPSSWRRSR